MKSQRILGLLLAIATALGIAACKGKSPDASASGGAAAKAAAASAGPVTPLGTSSIEGKVTLRGTPPPPTMLRMDADNFCLMQHPQPVPSDADAIHDGAVQWALVYVKSGLPAGARFAVPSSPAVLDQVGCMYVPHVLGVMAGQTLLVKNSDATLHNVHALCSANKAFNLGLPLKDMTQERHFDKAEWPPFHIKCDVHNWMSAWGAVFDHPFFAVTDAAGRYRIAGLPAGTYTVAAWHETLGTQEATVTVADHQAQTADLALSAPATR